MFEDFIYFDTAHCMIQSNLKDFICNRKFPENNPIKNIRVAWSEDWSNENNQINICTPYFIREFSDFKESSSFIYLLMANFTYSSEIDEEEFWVGNHMDEDFIFIKISRIRLEVIFEKD